MTQLTVYKASAGSGKTFRLTVEYLKILLNNPRDYKHILAITFTNKATAEMKGRIVAELHRLAEGKDSPYKTLLIEEMQLEDTEIVRRAKEAEQLILHDYGRFSVMTIDAFFQTVLKAFARELGVGFTSELELDDNKMRELAVEHLFTELTVNKELRKWLFDYSMEKVASNKSWNVTQDLFNLSKELVNENLRFLNRKSVEKWSDKEFIRQYVNLLNQTKETYVSDLKKWGKEAIDLLSSQGLEYDALWQGKRGVGALFYKLSKAEFAVTSYNTYHAVALNNPEKWYAKTAPADIKNRVDSIYRDLNALLGQIIAYIDEKARGYNSCAIASQNIHLMGVFSDIAKHLYELMSSEGKYMISERNKLLYQMIKGNEVPFIYEKTGNKYLYFLWDEFQDTSQLQWHNLSPLLSNALAEGNPCLIVGDVKQAIYRWRNGDWRILAEQLNENFPTLKEVQLQKNWRSHKRIIDFNNALFTDMPMVLENVLEKENGSISKLYSDAVQEYGKEFAEDTGYVHIQFYQNSEEEKAFDAMLSALPKLVEDLQEKGVKPNDIAFLVRKNSEAKIIADFFGQYTERKENIVYEVVSNEALLLSNAFVVAVLEASLHLLHLEESYYDAQLKLLCRKLPDGTMKFEKWKQYCTESSDTTVSLSMALRESIRNFGLEGMVSEQLYLLAFEEVTWAFDANEGSGLGIFLEWWQEQKDRLSIPSEEYQSAMQVLTVHKSKGLEFNTVIMPFYKEKLNNRFNGEVIWGASEAPPFDQVEQLLLPYGSSLQDTFFSEEYKEEEYNRYIDSLNNLYVGTTRAVQNLFILAEDVAGSGAYMSTLLKQHIENAVEGSFWGKYWNEETQEWILGTLLGSVSESVETVREISIKHPVYESIFERLPLRASTVDSAKSSMESNTPIQQGTLWHELMQDIVYYSDIPKAVKKAVTRGIISKSEAEDYIIHLQRLLQKEEIAPYYTATYTVQNERPLWVEGKQYIPDRVAFKGKEMAIIEYKFGQKQSNAHKKQVATYSQFYRSKGYEDIRAFIVYGVSEEVVVL